MGVRCLIVVVHRSHQASASPIHPTRSSHLPLISRSPKHNKCRSNHSSKDSLLLGKCVSLGHVHLTEWNSGLIYICLLTGSTDCSSYWMEHWAYLHLCADWQYWLLQIMQAGLGLLMVEIIIIFILINQNTVTQIYNTLFLSMCTGLTQLFFPISLASQGCVKMTVSYHDLWHVHPNNNRWIVQKWRWLLHHWILHLLLGSKYSYMAPLLTCPYSLYRLFCHFTVRRWTTSQVTSRVLSPDSHLILREDFLLSNSLSSLLASHRYEFQVVCYVIL